ncbi:MAG TPA: hypothetical protein DCP47_07455, partial [Phycisphaerales bacterium]|nr:hypothetical protein [Phycisphaerales bacterium]
RLLAPKPPHCHCDFSPLVGGVSKKRRGNLNPPTAQTHPIVILNEVKNLVLTAQQFHKTKEYFCLAILKPKAIINILLVFCF